MKYYVVIVTTAGPEMYRFDSLKDVQELTSEFTEKPSVLTDVKEADFESSGWMMVIKGEALTPKKRRVIEEYWEAE